MGYRTRKRDFLYVSDLINFVDLVIKKQKNKFEIYNCKVLNQYPYMTL